MHPTFTGLYPFLLGSPARCAFLSHYMCIYYLGSPARSRLSCSRSCPNKLPFWVPIPSYLQRNNDCIFEYYTLPHTFRADLSKFGCIPSRIW